MGAGPSIRRSAALVLSLEDAGVVGLQYLARTRAALSPLALTLLTRLESWQHPAGLFTGPTPRADVGAELLRLLDLGFVLVRGTPAAEEDERYAREWKWGTTAGHFHFGIKDPDYQGPEAVFQWLSHQVAAGAKVPLFTSHEGAETVVRWPPPALDDGLLGLMARRRSRRGFDPERPLPERALRDCLFSGFAIVAFADTAVAGEGPLPLRITPAGGARNAYEAYVVARAVEGLAPGVYHYAGVDHSLARVRGGVPPLASLLGGQAWFADAGAVVFLVACFDRLTWKYQHPETLRALLVEAGHVAQNLLLTAAAHGVAAVPTCAISDQAVEALCGLDRMKQAALHAVVLGAHTGRPSVADVHDVRPNPYFQRSHS